MKSILTGFLLIAILLTFSVVVSAAAPDASGPVFEAIGRSEIFADTGNLQQDKRLAKKAAIRKAYHHLMEEIRNAYSEGKLQGILSQDPGLDRVALRHIVRKAQLIDEQYVDGYYLVKLRLDLSDISQYRINEQEIQQGPFTGVVIDARNLHGHMQRAMSPAIKDINGNIIYGNVIPSGDFVSREGMVDYAQTEEDIDLIYAGLSRAGSHPLIIKAVGLNHFNENVIVGQDDAALILAADHDAGFLAKYAVVFIQ